MNLKYAAVSSLLAGFCICRTILNTSNPAQALAYLLASKASMLVHTLSLFIAACTFARPDVVPLSYSESEITPSDAGCRCWPTWRTCCCLPAGSPYSISSLANCASLNARYVPAPPPTFPTSQHWATSISAYVDFFVAYPNAEIERQAPQVHSVQDRIRGLHLGDLQHERALYLGGLVFCLGLPQALLSTLPRPL